MYGKGTLAKFQSHQAPYRLRATSDTRQTTLVDLPKCEGKLRRCVLIGLLGLPLVAFSTPPAEGIHSTETGEVLLAVETSCSCKRTTFDYCAACASGSIFDAPAEFLQSRQRANGGALLLAPVRVSLTKLHRAADLLRGEPDGSAYQDALRTVRAASHNCYEFDVS